MWYVIRTFTGKENEVCMWINLHVDKQLYSRCFVPLYEDVVRREGIGHIMIRRMFDDKNVAFQTAELGKVDLGGGGTIVFLESDDPEAVDIALKQMPEYSAVMAAPGEKEKLFLPIHRDEELFLDSILTDGIMRVSYIRTGRDHKIELAYGPLEKYIGNIVKLDLHHRRAVVRLPLFGEERQIKFGLWLDADPKLPRIEEEKKQRRAACRDKVINTRGLFGDTPLKVVAVDPGRNSVTVSLSMFGRDTDMEMSMDEVVREENS